MSAIENQTIDGLIEELRSSRSISKEDADILHDKLETETDGMSNEEISMVVKALNVKLNATGRNIITSTGINLSELDIAIKEAKVEAEKEIKTQAIDVQDVSNTVKQTEINPLQEIIKVLDSLDPEMIEKSRDSLNSFISDYLGLPNFKLPKEVEDLVSKQDVLLNLYEEKVRRYLSEGLSEEEAHSKTCEELEIPSDTFDSPEFDAVKAKRYPEKIKEIMEEKNCTEIEAIEILGQSRVYANVISKEQVEDIKNGKISTKDVIKGRFLEAVKYLGEVSLNKHVMQINKQAHDGFDVNIFDIQNVVRKKERDDRFLRTVGKYLKNIGLGEKEDLTNVDTEQRKIILKDAVEEYIVTDRSLSEIYERIKDDPNLVGVSFEDVLQNVKKELSQVLDKKELKELIKVEREINVLDETLRINEEIENNATDRKKSEVIREVNKGHKDKIRDDKAKMIAIAKSHKGKYISEKQIDAEKIAQKYKDVVTPQSQTKSQDDVGKQKKREESVETVMQKRNQVNNDRNNILKLAKENGISFADAAKQYFSENSDLLQNYSAKERSVLLGEGKKQSHTSRNGIGTYFRKILTSRNSRAIESLTVEKVKVAKTIEEEKGTGYDVLTLKDALIKSAEIEEKLRTLRRQQKLLTPKKSRTPEDILNEKNRKATIDLAYQRFIDSDLSVTEIFREIEAEGNEYGITIKDILKTVKKKNIEYLDGTDTNKLNNSENEIRKALTEIDALKIKKMNLKGDASRSTEYDDRIQKLMETIEKNRVLSKEVKTSVAVRRGFVSAKSVEKSRYGDVDKDNVGNAGPIENKQEDGKVVNNEGLPKEQNEAREQVDSEKKPTSLELSDISVKPTITPNVKEIAKKSKLTSGKVKDALSRIVNIRISKKATKGSQTQVNTQTDMQAQADVRDDEITQ